jgi:hypothetical protein
VITLMSNKPVLGIVLRVGLFDGSKLSNLRPHIRSVSASIHIDTRTDRN